MHMESGNDWADGNFSFDGSVIAVEDGGEISDRSGFYRCRLSRRLRRQFNDGFTLA